MKQSNMYRHFITFLSPSCPYFASFVAARVRVVFLTLFLSLLTLPALAQQVPLNPVPQSIKWGEKAFLRAEATYRMVGAESADPYAVRLLKGEQKDITPSTRPTLDIAADGRIVLAVGEADDEAVENYAASIPTQAEGYFLRVTPDSVILAGRDEAGTYYAAQTLMQILRADEVMSVTVKDFPSTAQRGVIEGFYGNPWSTEDRKRQFDFYAENKMNVYVYGPKNDPYHRTKWRTNYPAKEGAVISELAQYARERHVDFIWAIHTGGSISNSESDFKAVVSKLENVYSLGVRNFSIFFDDFGSADATLQCAELNYVWENFIQKHDDLHRLSMCPTQYNAAYAGWNANSSYLNGLRDRLNKQIEIMWTGDGVADMINESDITFFRNATGRYPFIWLNYPVNDYCIGHMLMGKFYGNDTGNNSFGSRMTAFTSNPMEYAEASKVALFGVADYSWNMKSYNPEKNWERAISAIMPTEPEAFHVFCEHNVDLGSTVHGLRRTGESPNFDPAAPAQIIKEQFQKMIGSADALLNDRYNTNLIKEITPWLYKMKMMGQRGVMMMEMEECIANGNTALFIDDYKQVKAIAEQEDALISRDFEGTIKSARPVVADQKVAPYLKEKLTKLVADYKARYTDGWDNFEAVVLENGNYYIRVNGKYLYNRNASSTRTGDYPIFADVIDDAQPQKCEWTITLEAATNRYKIANTQDGRYVNEKGAFWESRSINPYDPAWHTYHIYRLNGKYAIQNAGSAGKNFWGVDDTRIVKTNHSSYSYEDAVFEIIPVGGTQPQFPVVGGTTSYFIMNSDSLMLTTTSSAKAESKPTFQTHKRTDTYQRWNITPDPASGRWKIAMASKPSKFLDEFGCINKNPYYSSWNSYSLYENGGKWAIQNGGDAGTGFWSISDNVISSTSGNPLEKSYQFIIIPVDVLDGVEDISAGQRGMDHEPSVLYDLSGRPLSHPTSRGIYIQDRRKVVAF